MESFLGKRGRSLMLSYPSSSRLRTIRPADRVLASTSSWSVDAGSLPLYINDFEQIPNGSLKRKGC